MSGNMELNLISKILHTGDFTIPTDMGITQRYFNGKNKKAFKIIQAHMLKYGNVPDLKTFKTKMRNYDILASDSVNEGLRFYCDEVRMKLKHNTIVDSMEEISGHIEGLETEEAYELLKQLVVKVETEVILSDREEVNKDTSKRLDDYFIRQQTQGMTGIPTGNSRIDYVLKGYNAGELIALLGYTGTGKSWWKLIQAVYQAKQGYKVLFFTTEMSTKMIIRRIDALWCKLSYTRFRNGKLTPDELKKYEKYLKSVDGDEDSNLIVEQATGGVSQIGAKIDQHNPDIVYVDGAYLLQDDESNDDDWKAIVRVFRGLHRLALNKNIPIIASTQSNDRKVSLSTISFAKALSNDCDVVMAIEQDDEMKEDKEIKTKFLKIREGEGAGNIVQNWDFNEMNYDPIYIEGENGNPVGAGNKDSDVEPVKLKGIQVLK
jgi:replicative DNA helicase